MTVSLKVRTKQPREQLQALHRSIPSIISGRRIDQFGLRQAYWSAFLHHLMFKIHEAFLAKSDGGADEVGETWKPLERSTIAQRPIAKGEIGQLDIGGRASKAFKRRERGLLTPEQNKIWSAIFASTLARLRVTEGEAKAKEKAAELAWAVLKSRGAQTKLDVLGGRKVPILIRTGRLEKAIRPGQLSGENISQPDEQTLINAGSRLQIDIDVPYSDAVHKKRRLWPPVRKMTPWLNEAAQKGADAVAHKLSRRVRHG